MLLFQILYSVLQFVVVLL